MITSCAWRSSVQVEGCDGPERPCSRWSIRRSRIPRSVKRIEVVAELVMVEPGTAVEHDHRHAVGRTALDDPEIGVVDADEPAFTRHAGGRSPRLAARDPERRVVDAVAPVDRDQQRRERLRDPRHLQPSDVDPAHAGDLLDQPAHGRFRLGRRRPSRARRSRPVGPARATPPRPPCGTRRPAGYPFGSSVFTNSAAEPCHGRIAWEARPPTAAISGLVQSTTIVVASSEPEIAR